MAKAVAMASTGYAGFWKRFLAYILDCILLGIVGFVIGLAMGGASMMPSIDVGATGEQGNPLVGIISLIISWLYFALMESSEKQATLGKMALGIAVTDLQGKRISFGRATGRHFAKIISGIIIGIGYIMAGFTQKKQGLHDMIAGTLVINRKA